jgi:TonB family protein
MVSVAKDRAADLVNLREILQELIRSYPPQPAGQGIAGTHVSFVMIDSTGVVTGRWPVRSSGRLRLDQAAARIVTLMRYAPSIVNGCRAPTTTLLPVALDVVSCAPSSGDHHGGPHWS